MGIFMDNPDKAKHGKKHYRGMTVANIREQKEMDFVEIVFLESTRFYKLPRNNPAFEKALDLLRKSLEKGSVLKVGIASLDSDIIEEIQEHSSEN
jgi:hypothetical protein